MLALLGKNPRTTLAAILVALASVLSSGVAVEFSPAAAKWFHLASGLLMAIGLVFAKDALDAPVPVAPGASK